MEFWQRTCLLLCLYGFFKELRPSEPFLTEYLLGPVHNLTEEEVYYEVYPVWTYSYLAVLVVVFLLTDILRYKPVVVFEAAAYIVTWVLLLWARGVFWMQMVEFTYGIVTATEVAYFTYIYAQVDECHYQRVSSYTRTALLCGRFSAGVLAQVLYSTGLMDAHTLNYLTLAAMCVAAIFAVSLPPVKHSIYFHREKRVTTQDGGADQISNDAENQFSGTGTIYTACDFGTKVDAPNSAPDNDQPPSIYQERNVTQSRTSTARKVFSEDPNISINRASSSQKSQIIQKNKEANKKIILADNKLSFDDKVLASASLTKRGYTIERLKEAAALMWTDFLTAYKNKQLVRWSVWWSAATCGYFQVLNYIQPLYESVLLDDQTAYNGAVDAACTLLGASAALAVAFIKVNWSRTGEVILGLVSLVDAILLLYMGFTNSIIAVYIGYVAFRVTYEFLITVASYQVAKGLTSDSYGLVFGVNMFLSLLLQTIVTLVVVDALHTPPKLQFVIYGSYFAVLSLLFLALAAFRLGSGGCKATT